MKVLFECHDLTLRNGTGIATYLRSLVRVVRGLGHDTQALHGVRHKVGRHRTALDEIRLHEVPVDKNPTLATRILRPVRSALSTPFGTRPQLLRPSDFVIDPDRSSVFSSFDDVYVATRLFEKARLHINLYKRLMPLSFETPPDVFHASRPVPLHSPKSANVYTIHDLIPLRLPQTTLDNKRHFYSLLKTVTAKADHIVTVSENSKRDICKLFGVEEKRITNTYQSVGFPRHLTDKPDADVARELDTAYDLEFGEYFLFVGALEPKKNVRRLVEAYSSVRTTRPLVIVGGLGWMFDGDLERINDEGFLQYEIVGSAITPRRQVRRLAFVPFTRLVSLIRGARALLFPSLYEGFGLPVLEAMHLGTPVLTSNVASLPEVAGGAALLVDPYDIDAIAKGIAALDADADLRADLRSRGLARAAEFSEERYRARVNEMYARLAG